MGNYSIAYAIKHRHATPKVKRKRVQINKDRRKNPISDHNINLIGIEDLYIYFIQVKGTIIYKIGVTNNPFKRVEVLQTGCPFDIELKMAFVTTKAKDVELKIHHKLKQYHLRGEWFNVTDDHINQLKSELQ